MLISVGGLHIVLKSFRQEDHSLDLPVKIMYKYIKIQETMTL